MKTALFCFFIGFSCFSTYGVNVTFVSPSATDDPFWEQYKGIMQSAARDLEIELTIINSQHLDRFGHLDALTKALNAKPKPDYIVTLFRKNTIEKWLSLTQQANVKFVATNADIPPHLASKIGPPRSLFKNWIAHIRPDDFHAGELLTHELIKATQNQQKKHLVVALTGSHESIASSLRIEGMKSVLATTSNWELQQILYTNWSYQDAYDKTQALLTRYPNTDVFWSASDRIALSAHNASLKQGKQIITGGIDWSSEGFEAFSANISVTSIGGHFIEGGIALSLIRDHADGEDFADRIGVNPKMQMAPLNKDNFAYFNELVTQHQWQKLDFSLLSKSMSQDKHIWSNNYVEIIKQISKPQ